MILKKTSISWWTTQSLVSLLYVYLFFLCSYILSHSLQLEFFFFMIIRSYVFIDLFIAGKAFIFMFICSYVLIHSLIHSLHLNFYLYIYLFLWIDSFIAATAFAFMIIFFYVLIHSLIHSLQVKQWKTWRINARWT